MNRIAVCLGCRRERPHAARGLCGACYAAKRHRGTVAEVPRIGRPVLTDAKRGRLEDFAELLGWGVTFEGACSRLGVTERTGWRYMAHLRSQEVAALAAVTTPAKPAGTTPRSPIRARSVSICPNRAALACSSLACAATGAAAGRLSTGARTGSRGTK